MPPVPNTSKLTGAELSTALARVEGWKLSAESVAPTIEKSWRFADFHQTMAFVNAVAQVAHSLDHHPELHVSYSGCVVSYTTHDAGGLTPRDIEAALLINALPEGLVRA